MAERSPHRLTPIGELSVQKKRRGCLWWLLGAVVIVVGVLVSLFVAVHVWYAVNPAPPELGALLHNTLLTAKYPDSQMPRNSYAEKPLAFAPDKAEREQHELGIVQVPVAASDQYDAVRYDFFTNGSSAKAAMEGRQEILHQHLLPGGVPGSGNLPSRFWLGSVRTKDSNGRPTIDGIALPRVVTGNIVVSAIAVSGFSTNKGDVPAAVALLRSALRHLRIVEAALR